MKEINVEYLPVWRRYLEQVRTGGLSDKELGALFRAMMEYQFEGKAPEHLSGSAEIFWLFFQSDLDYARKRYETSVENGRKGGRKKNKKPEETQCNPEEANTITESIQNNNKDNP